MIWDAQDSYVILDTETTGLGENDVIVQIGICNLKGEVLLDSLVKPTKRKRISKEATAIHHITMGMLENEPTFKELYPQIRNIFSKKGVLIYNVKFDSRLIKQTSKHDGVSIEPVMGHCVMKDYAEFVGEWSEYHGNYKYQKLLGGDHSAIGDCLATLDVLKTMKEELHENQNSHITGVSKLINTFISALKKIFKIAVYSILIIIAFHY